MTPLTDDELGALLTQTFTAHEHLADPERAAALAADPHAPRHTEAARAPRRAPVLLAAAASVALVAAGTTYLVSQGGDSAPVGGPNHPMNPTSATTFVVGPTVTRKEAREAAKRVIARVAVFPHAQETVAAGVPELHGPGMSSNPRGYTLTRSRWWTVGGTTPKAVIHWYNRHPTRGFVSDGGVGSMSGTGDPTIEFVDFHRRGSADQVVTPVGVTIHYATTTTAAGVGIRATVESVWSPKRAAASYAKDVTSIDVRRTTTRYGHHVRTTHHSWRVTDPGHVADVVKVFNGLAGVPPTVLNCPLIVKTVEYRVVFRSPHATLVAQVNAGPCAHGVTVSRHGTVLSPALGGVVSLITALNAAR